MEPKFESKKPFIKLTKQKQLDEAWGLFEALTEYAGVLEDMVTVKFPEIMESAEKLPAKGEAAKDTTKDEFEALDAFAKAKAGVAMAESLESVAKLPNYIKNVIATLKKDFEEFLAAVNELKEHMNQYGDHGKKCHTDKVKGATACRKHIYGPTKYTPEERKKWEAEAKHTCHKNHKKFAPLE